MVMTIHKLSAGDGYTYLTRQVAGGDAQQQRGQTAGDYYTQAGNPPGVWMGRGAHLLGLDGRQVTEAQMKALFGDGAHPDAEAMIDAYIARHRRPDMTPAQVNRLVAEAEKTVQLGRRFGAYKRLDPFGDRVEARLATIEEQTGRAPTPVEVKAVKRQESARQRAGVAGFDVVFSPVKSAALVWALHPNAQVRTAVKTAHDAAVDSAMGMLEDHAAFTRAGTGGVAQIETKGLIAARFDHHDSRAGDPNLHTHVPILNKVQGVDGKWRSLDARGLYAMTVAASEHYNTRFETEMAHRLGVTFTARADTGKGNEPVREVTGVPGSVVKHFSRRRLDVETRYRQLIAAYRADHGYDPAASVCHGLARQATLDTRPGKDHLRSLKQMRTEWAAELDTEFGPKGLAAITTAVPVGSPTATPATEGWTPDEVDQAAAAVVTRVAESRATWTRWNLHAETERALRVGHRFTTPAAHAKAVEEVMDAAMSPAHSIRIDAPVFVPEPDQLRRSDGESVFAAHASTRFTSTAILDAEQRLLAAAHTSAGQAIDPATVTAALDGFEAGTGSRLDAGQRAMAAAFATDPRHLVVGLGPAGTGKTTTMRAYLHTLHASGRRLVPLATSATAAAVLAGDLGVPADNVHKFIHEHQHGPHAQALAQGQPAPRQAEFFALKPGDVVLVDEAGMAGTLNLDQLTAIAARYGAQVRLLGDHRQLSAVESGGALRLIAAEAGAVELTDLHRFTDPREAAATLALRDGDPSGLDFYEAHHRIRGGSKTAMIDAAYTAWRTDTATGKSSVMVAASNVDVTALSARARADRVARGDVEAGGITLHDGNTAGRGDWIITRDNHRRLTINGGKDFVRNGAAWTVHQRHRDGGLTVKPRSGRGTVRLPADYVSQYVELGYATTINRIQGATVDTVHVLAAPDLAREHLYVAATRARTHTTVYTVTHDLLPLNEDDRLDRPPYDPDATSAREVLEQILARDTGELSATETIRTTQQRAESLSVLVPQFQHALEHATRAHYTHITTHTLGQATAETVVADGFGPVVRALLDAETRGWAPDRILAFAAAQGDPTHPEVESPAALLAWRIHHLARNHTPPAPIAAPTRADTTRYARHLQRHHRLRLDPDTAVTPPTHHQPGKREDQPKTITTQQVRDWASHLATRLHMPVSAVESHVAWPRFAATLAALDHHGGNPKALITTAAHATTPGQPATQNLTAVARTATRLTKSEGMTGGEVGLPLPVRAHQDAITVLGPDKATVMRGAAAWPAVVSALHKGEQLGHPPDVVLRRAAAQRDLQGVNDLASLMAWRIGIHNRLNPAGSDTTPHETWRALAWNLKAYEQHGGNPARLIRATAGHDLDYVLLRIQDETRHAAAAAKPAPPVDLPWIKAPATILDTTATDPRYTHYLRQLADQINTRITETTTAATTDKPQWTNALGEPPTNPDQHAQWHTAVTLTAAYRDQHNITDDDPDQPLGPYVPEGRAGHQAWWDTATAIIATSNSDHRPSTGLGIRVEDQITHDIATATYQALPLAQRHAIANNVLERAGIAWDRPDSGAEDAVTQPALAKQLRAALIDSGHLPREQPHSKPPAPGPNAHPIGTPKARRPAVTSPVRQPAQQRQAHPTLTPQILHPPNAPQPRPPI